MRGREGEWEKEKQSWSGGRKWKKRTERTVRVGKRVTDDTNTAIGEGGEREKRGTGVTETVAGVG